MEYTACASHLTPTPSLYPDVSVQDLGRTTRAGAGAGQAGAVWVPLCPASRHRGPGLADVAAAALQGDQAGREGLRREAGRKVCPAAEAGTPAPGCAPARAAPVARLGVLLAMGKSRSDAARGVVPAIPSMRTPSAPGDTTGPDTAHSGGEPGNQALAGGWEGTWAHFLPCSLLPRKEVTRKYSLLDIERLLLDHFKPYKKPRARNGSYSVDEEIEAPQGANSLINSLDNPCSPGLRMLS